MRLFGLCIILLMETLKMYSTSYDFTALDDYFQRINKWQGLTDEDKSEILLKTSTPSGWIDSYQVLELVEQLLKEKNTL